MARLFEERSILPFSLCFLEKNAPLPPAWASTLPFSGRWSGLTRPGGWRSLLLLLLPLRRWTRKKMPEEQQRQAVAAAEEAEEEQGEQMSTLAAAAEEGEAEAEAGALGPRPAPVLLQGPGLPCDREETRGARLRWTREEPEREEEEEEEVAASSMPTLDGALRRRSRFGSLLLLLRLRHRLLHPARADPGSPRTPLGPPRRRRPTSRLRRAPLSRTEP